MADNKNDALAAGIGSDKPVKQPIENYDREHGTYECNMPEPKVTPRPAGPQPFGGLRKR